MDVPLGHVKNGNIVLINLRPQEFNFEVHEVMERIVCISGKFTMEEFSETTPYRKVVINQGEMAKVPIGVDHRFGNDSDAVILTIIG